MRFGMVALSRNLTSYGFVEATIPTTCVVLNERLSREYVMATRGANQTASAAHGRNQKTTIVPNYARARAHTGWDLSINPSAPLSLDRRAVYAGP